MALPGTSGGSKAGFTAFERPEEQNPLSVDDVTTMIAEQIGQIATMDEETADLFQQLAKKMIEQAGELSKKNYWHYKK